MTVPGAQSSQGRAWIPRLTHLAEWVAGLGFLAHAIVIASEALHKGDWPERLLHFRLGWPWQLAVLVCLAGVWVVARYPRVRMRLVRLVAGPPAPPVGTRLLFHGPRPYAVGEHLPGRQADGEACLALLQQAPFMVLEGESGSGKSSLLNALLIPQAQTLFTPVSMRPGDDPYRNTVLALRRVAPEAGERAATAQGVGEALAAVAAHATREPAAAAKALLLCIDQFEELFRTADHERRSAFLGTLRAAVEAGHVRVVAVIRSDFVDLLVNLCREVDPGGRAFDLGNFYVLKPFRRAQTIDVLREILSPIAAANRRLEHELALFAEALVEELLQPPRDPRLSRDDPKTVLPAELQIVGTMIESLGVEHFTESSFRSRGGRNGLLDAYLQGAKTYVSRKTAVSGDKALLVLRQLIPQTTEDHRARSAPAIADALGWPVATVTRVLDAFAERKLVNPLPANPSAPEGGASSEPRYELMHEHLGRILEEAPDPVLRRAREAEVRLRFWRGRTATADEAVRARSLMSRLAHLLYQPVSIGETLRLWTAAGTREDRRMLRRSLATFTLRCALVAALAAAGLAATYTDRYQVHMVLWDTPSVDPVRGLWALDDWSEVLWRAGRAGRARAEVTRALAEVASRGDAVRYKFATTILSAIEGELLHAVGDASTAESRFGQVRAALGDFTEQPLARFATAARLAQALGRSGRLAEAVDAWRSALRDLRTLSVSATQPDGQFLYAARALSELPQSARGALWMEAVHAARRVFQAPLNCWVLSELAVELYKNGDTAIAETVWGDAISAAKAFRSAPAFETNMPSTVPTLRPPPAPRPSPRTDAGTLSELAFTDDPRIVRMQRGYALARIARHMYDAGKKADARGVWSAALAEGEAVERTDAPLAERPIPVAGATALNPLPRPAVVTPLGLYHEVAEDLIRTGEADLAPAVEAAIARVVDRRIDEAGQRAQYAMASAGRLAALDPAGSKRAWQRAIDAAAEIRDGDDAPGNPEPRATLPEPLPGPARNERLQQVRTALSRTKDPSTRSGVLHVATWTLVRFASAEREPGTRAAHLAEALEMARAITDEQVRRQLLQRVAMDLLDRNQIPAADAFIQEVRQEARSTRADDVRSAQLAWLAKFEARRGRLRDARRVCERCLSVDALSVFARILWEYEAPRHPEIAQALERRDVRYQEK